MLERLGSYMQINKRIQYINTHIHIYIHTYINTQERNEKDDKEDKAELAVAASSDYQKQQQKLITKKNKAQKNKLVEVCMCASMCFSIFVYVCCLLFYNFNKAKC